MIYTETEELLSESVRSRGKRAQKKFSCKNPENRYFYRKTSFLFIHRTDQIVSQETKYLIASEQNVDRMLQLRAVAVGVDDLTFMISQGSCRIIGLVVTEGVQDVRDFVYLAQ